MAKYELPFEDTQKLFTDAISLAELDRYISVKLLTDMKAKKIIEVKKAADLIKYETGVDVHIIINEDIFDKLEDSQKQIAVDSAIAKIYYNTEKEKLEIKKEDFIAFSGMLNKYTPDILIRFDESVKSLFNAAKENQ